MPSLLFEERLLDWKKFRQSLETSVDPLNDLIQYYNQIPVSSMYTDPYNPNIWLGPWELIYQNVYCDYCIILGMCYTLQLTDRFTDTDIEIHISIDYTNNEQYYLLRVGDRVLGYDKSIHVDWNEVSKKVISQRIYSMPPLN